MIHALAILQALAWAPVFLHFLRAWRARRNPISLAIAVLVLVAFHASLVPLWLGLDDPVVYAAMTAPGLFACAHFRLAFHKARGFQNGRRD